MGGPGDRNVSFIVAAKEVTESNAPAGAALIAQAMDRREGAGRYKAMQSIMDWDRSRLVYRAVKRTFDIVFSGAVLVVIAIPSLVLAATSVWRASGSPSTAKSALARPPRRQPDYLPHVEVPKHVQGRRRAPRRAQGAERDRRRHVQDEGGPPRHQDREVHPQTLHRRVPAVPERFPGPDVRRGPQTAAAE